MLQPAPVYKADWKTQTPYDPEYKILTLYHDNASYNSQKVRLYLFENNIPWNGVHFDLLKQEHLTEDYLKINPNGLVPALVDDGVIILNSTDIIKHLEKNYSMADAVVTAFVCRIKRLDFSNIVAQYPLLSNYYIKMKARKSFEAAGVS